MDIGRWRKIDDVFNAALVAASDRRADVLAQGCGADLALRAEVESLLSAHERSSHLDSPAFDSAQCVPRDDSLFIKPGERIGRYTLIRVIGRGGTGVVYEAQQDEPSRIVALKVIRALPHLDDLTPRLFRREGQALARLAHPGIAPIYEAGHIDGLYYFAMERVEGSPLTEYARCRALTLRKRLELMRRVCDAVQYAHQRGVTHRDLKPSNILVTESGEPKVLDFGLARITEPGIEHTRITDPGTFRGTLAYSSPEQVCGAETDTRGDVFSLGVVLFELLTGALPCDLAGVSAHEAVRLIVEHPPRRLTQAASGQDRHLLRGDLETIVAKTLEKEPQRRYDGVAALSDDIDRYLNGSPVLAHPPSTAYQLRKFIVKHKAGSAVAATFLLVVSGFAVAMNVMYRESQRNLAGAEAAGFRERVQRELAEKREKETKQVSEFQAAMLSEIDVEDMGRGIKQRFREQVRAALERQYVGEYPDHRKRTPEEIETELAAFDHRAEAAQAADVARGVMDEFVLARAAAAMEKEFADQPLVRAQLHNAIGHTYTELGLFDAAEPHLLKALEVRRRELGDVHKDVAETLWELASLRWDQLDYAAAEPLLRQALAVYRAVQGDESADVAAVLDVLAGTLHSKGEDAEAERYVREALAIRRKLFGDRDAIVALNMSNLAALLMDRGDSAAAEELLREAMEIHRKAPGPEPRWLAGTLDGLARLLWMRGDYAGAVPLAREALAIQRKLHGDEHALVSQAMHNLACLLRDQGDYPAAEALFTEALAFLRKVEHPGVASTLDNLGRLLLKRGDYAAAVPVFREALAIHETALGPDSSDDLRVVDARSLLGGALAGHGAALIESDATAAISKFIEAEPLLVKSAEWMTQNADRIPPQSRAARLRSSLERTVNLYESWDIVAPSSGKAERATQWRTELEKLAGP